MVRNLQKLVDFTSSECLSCFFKPVVIGRYGSSGVHPIDVVMDNDNLILGDERIPLESIKNLELGYISDEHKDRIEKINVNSVDDLASYVRKKRYSVVDHDLETIPLSYHFPFYEADKIGGGFAIIQTEEEQFEIYYPTKKISCEVHEEE